METGKNILQLQMKTGGIRLQYIEKFQLPKAVIAHNMPHFCFIGLIRNFLQL
jgi:hypothetical protein